MTGLVVGYSRDAVHGRVALVVDEDATVAVYVRAGDMRSAAATEGQIHIQGSPPGPVSVTVGIGDAARPLAVLAVNPEGIHTGEARDIGLARCGRIEPWRVSKETFTAVAGVLADGHRTTVTWPSGDPVVLRGRVPRRVAARIAHESIVDERVAGGGLAAVPADVLAEYPATVAAYGQLAAGSGIADVRKPRVFRSGLSRVGDIASGEAAGVPIGVVITELSERATAMLVDANERGVPVFIDSGAYGARGEGEPGVDFALVCRRYQAIAARARHPELLTVVAPDVIRDRKATLELLAIHATSVRALIDAGVDVIVAMQKDFEGGATFADTYRETVAILGTDNFRPAFPARVSAITDEEVLAFVGEISPPRIHLLGIANSPDFPLRLRRLAGLSPTTDVSSDACHFRAGLGRGRPLQRAIDDSLARAAWSEVHGGVAWRPDVLADRPAPPLPARDDDAQVSLFDAPAGVRIADAVEEFTEFLHAIYNTPGVLARDEAVELAGLLTRDQRLAMAIVGAAQVAAATPEAAVRMAVEMTGGITDDYWESGIPINGNEAWGSPLGYVLDVVDPGGDAVYHRVRGWLVDRARRRLSPAVRADEFARAEAQREFWQPFDDALAHPFTAGMTATWRDEHGRPDVLADGSMLAWQDRLQWFARRTGSLETDDAGRVEIFEDAACAYVTAAGRVAAFEPAAARRAFEAIAERGLADYLSDPGESNAAATRPGRLVVVPCGRRKAWEKNPALGPLAARDVYTSNLFRLHMAYADLVGDRTIILSARHGLIDPSHVIEGPYDTSFVGRDPDAVDMATLRRQARDLDLARFGTVTALGGVEYRRRVREVFAGAAVTVDEPFAGLEIGDLQRAVQQFVLSHSDIVKERQDPMSDSLTSSTTQTQPADGSADVTPRTVEPAAGDHVVFMPHGADREPTRGIVVERITNTSGGIGYHVFVADPEYPGRTDRVWLADGRMVVLAEGSPIVDTNPAATSRPVPLSREGGVARRPDADEIIGELKWLGLERTKAWSSFLIKTALRPGMDASEFYARYDAAPKLPTRRPTPPARVTHTLVETWPGAVPKRVAIVEDSPDVVRWIDEHGSTGSSPRDAIATLERIDDDGSATSPAHAIRDSDTGAAPGPPDGAASESASAARVDGEVEQGDVFTAVYPGGATDEFMVYRVTDAAVEIGRTLAERAETIVPKDTFAQFRDDMRAVVRVAPTSGDPVVDALARGECEYLGKGDDGMVFRVEGDAVKVSTVVPYVPTNPRHLTPEAAVERLRAQVRVSEQLRRAGVGAIPETRFVEHGGKGFAIRPLVAIGGALGADLLDDVQRAVIAINRAGFALNDTIQVGEADGAVVLFDTGKAAPLAAEPKARESQLDRDLVHIKQLYGEHGHTFAPLGGYGLETAWRALANPLQAAMAVEREGVESLHGRIGRMHDLLLDEARHLEPAERETVEARIEREYRALALRFAIPLLDESVDAPGARPPGYTLTWREYVAANGYVEPAGADRTTDDRRLREGVEAWGREVYRAAVETPERVPVSILFSYENGRDKGAHSGPPLPERALERLSDREREILARNRLGRERAGARIVEWSVWATRLPTPTGELAIDRTLVATTVRPLVEHVASLGRTLEVSVVANDQIWAILHSPLGDARLAERVTDGRVGEVAESLVARERYTLDSHRALEQRLLAGDLPAATLAAVFEDAVDSGTGLRWELDRMRTEALAPLGLSGQTREELIEETYARMIGRFALGRAEPASRVDDEVVRRVRDIVHTLTDADVAAYAASLIAIADGDETPPPPPQSVASFAIRELARGDRTSFVLTLAETEWTDDGALARIEDAALDAGGERVGHAQFAFASLDAAEGLALNLGLSRAADLDHETSEPATYPGIRAPAAERTDEDLAMFDRLIEEARGRSHPGESWVDAVRYPWPEMPREGIASLLVDISRDGEAAEMAHRTAVIASGPALDGTVVFRSRPGVEDLAGLVAHARARGVDPDKVEPVARAVRAAERLAALAISEARLAGVLAAHDAERSRRAGAPLVDGVETDIPVDFLVDATFAPVDADAKDARVTVGISPAGEVTVFSGHNLVHAASAGGAFSIRAHVADDAIPALARYEESVALGPRLTREVEISGPVL